MSWLLGFGVAFFLGYAITGTILRSRFFRKIKITVIDKDGCSRTVKVKHGISPEMDALIQQVHEVRK